MFLLKKSLLNPNLWNKSEKKFSANPNRWTDGRADIAEFIWPSTETGVKNLHQKMMNNLKPIKE